MAEQADGQLVWTQVSIRLVYSILVACGILHVLFISRVGQRCCLLYSFHFEGTRCLQSCVIRVSKLL